MSSSRIQTYIRHDVNACNGRASMPGESNEVPATHTRALLASPGGEEHLSHRMTVRRQSSRCWDLSGFLDARVTNLVCLTTSRLSCVKLLACRYSKDAPVFLDLASDALNEEHIRCVNAYGKPQLPMGFAYISQVPLPCQLPVKVPGT